MPDARVKGRTRNYFKRKVGDETTLKFEETNNIRTVKKAAYGISLRVDYTYVPVYLCHMTKKKIRYAGNFIVHRSLRLIVWTADGRLAARHLPAQGILLY